MVGTALPAAAATESASGSGTLLSRNEPACGPRSRQPVTVTILVSFSVFGARTGVDVFCAIMPVPLNQTTATARRIFCDMKAPFGRAKSVPADFRAKQGPVFHLTRVRTYRRCCAIA